MAIRVDGVVFLDLLHNHVCSDGCSTRIVDKMIMSFPGAHLHSDHIRTYGVKPFGIAGSLGHGNVGFVEPGIGKGGRKEEW
jgi:hypothetical protein